MEEGSDTGQISLVGRVRLNIQRNNNKNQPDL